MFENVRRLFPADVFLLIGSRHTYIAAVDGKVLRVPTRVLVKKKNYEVVAFGDEAREVEHAGLAETKIIVPFGAQEIVDEAAASAFLRSLFRVVLGSGFFLKPRVWMGLSHQVTPFMRELWQNVAVSAGARELITVDELLAGSVGAGLDVFGSHGYAVASCVDERVDLGLVSFGHVQVRRSFVLPEGDWKADHAVAWGEGWKEFVSLLPAEFATTVLQEGVFILASEGDNDHSARLTKTLSLPVIIAQRSIAVAGLRTVATQKMEAV